MTKSNTRTEAVGQALRSIVSLKAEVPPDAFTAGVLGTERDGHALIIDRNGLLLTVGYLIAEADRIWLMDQEETLRQADAIAYDYESGFGLVRAREPFDQPPLAFGTAASLSVGDRCYFAASGGETACLDAQLVGKRQFAGYWEYVLDEALFTAPAHPSWGGAALLDRDGKLVGVGSLYVQNARGGDQRSDGNMSIPIDLLTPILDNLKNQGTSGKPARPWLGMFVAEAEDHLIVMGVAEGGPAERAGLRGGDVIIDIGGSPVGDLADLFKTIWEMGPAGVDIPMTIIRDGEARRLNIHSADRSSFMRPSRLH